MDDLTLKEKIERLFSMNEKNVTNVFLDTIKTEIAKQENREQYLLLLEKLTRESVERVFISIVNLKSYILPDLYIQWLQFADHAYTTITSRKGDVSKWFEQNIEANFSKMINIGNPDKVMDACKVWCYTINNNNFNHQEFELNVYLFLHKSCISLILTDKSKYLNAILESIDPTKVGDKGFLEYMRCVTDEDIKKHKTNEELINKIVPILLFKSQVEAQVNSLGLRLKDLF